MNKFCLKYIRRYPHSSCEDWSPHRSCTCNHQSSWYKYHFQIDSDYCRIHQYPCSFYCRSFQIRSYSHIFEQRLITINSGVRIDVDNKVLSISACNHHVHCNTLNFYHIDRHQASIHLGRYNNCYFLNLWSPNCSRTRNYQLRLHTYHRFHIDSDHFRTHQCPCRFYCRPFRSHCYIYIFNKRLSRCFEAGFIRKNYFS